MELRQLRYFIAVADMLNFSRASESLFLSQSALSRQISDLEDELGVVLFNRDRHSVALTAAGKLMLSEAKSILLQTEKLAPLLHSAAQETQEENVFIGVDARLNEDLIVHRVLTEVVYQWRQAYPGIRALFFSQEQTELQTALDKGELTVGLMLSPEPTLEPGVTTKILREDELVLVTRREIAGSEQAILEQLLDYSASLVLAEKDTALMTRILLLLNELNFAPAIRFAENRASMLLNVESGDGSTILPESIVRRLENPDLRIYRFPTQTAKLYLLAVWQKNGGRLAEQIVADSIDALRRIEEKTESF